MTVWVANVEGTRHLRQHRQRQGTAGSRGTLIAKLPNCPIPEVAGLCRTLRAGRAPVFPGFDTPAESATAAPR